MIYNLCLLRKRKAVEEEEDEQKKKIQKEWDKNYEVSCVITFGRTINRKVWSSFSFKHCH